MKVDIQVHHLEDILDVDKLNDADIKIGLALVDFSKDTDTFHVRLDAEKFQKDIRKNHSRAMKAIREYDLKVDDVMEEMLLRIAKAYMFNKACADFSEAIVALFSQVAKGYGSNTMTQVRTSCGEDVTKDLVDLLQHLMEFKLKEVGLERGDDAEVPY